MTNHHSFQSFVGPNLTPFDVLVKRECNRVIYSFLKRKKGGRKYLPYGSSSSASNNVLTIYCPCMISNAAWYELIQQYVSPGKRTFVLKRG